MMEQDLQMDFNVKDEVEMSKGSHSDSYSIHEVPLHCPSDGIITEIVEGSKRSSKVFIDEMNYAYLQNKRRKNGGCILRCYTCGCHATGVYKPETSEFHRLKGHSHVPNASMLDKWRFLSKVKERAENEGTKLKAIYEEEALMFNGIELPSFEKIKSSLRKRRNRALQTAGNPSTNIGIDPLCSQGLMTHYFSTKRMEMIEGPKRYSKIYIDDLGYCYQVNRKRPDGGIFLRCHRDGCRGSAIYNSHDGTYEKLAKHSHYADPQQVKKWRFLHVIKKRAENETTPLKYIYGEEAKRYKNCDLPPFKRVESTLQKRRKDCATKERKRALQDQMVGEKDVAYMGDSSLTDAYERADDIHVKATQHSPAECDEDDAMPLNKVVTTSGSRVIFAHESPSVLVDVQPEKSRRKLKTKDVCPKAKKRRKRNSKTLVKNINGRRVGRRRYRVPSAPKVLSEYCSKMEIIEGQKRYSKMFIDEASFMYRLNKIRPDGIFILKCHTADCRGSGYYFPKESNFKRQLEHSHTADVTQVDQLRFLSLIKNRAEIESTPLRTIYEDELSKHPGIQVMDFDRIVSTLQKRRRSKYPSEPQSIEKAKTDLESFFSNEYGRAFYRQHLVTREGDSEMLVFISSGELQDEFCKCTTAHFDISLKVVPQAFEKFLIINLVIEDHAFPGVYALITKGCESAYLCLLDYLVKEFPSFSPSTITTDYEFFLERALQSAFPHAIINGCWFYYAQSVWRQSQLTGLAQVIYQDEFAKRLLNSIMALPLLPASFIPPGVNHLIMKCDENAFLLPETRGSALSVIDYVKAKWIQHIGVHRLSVFKMSKRLSYDIEALYCLYIKKFGVKASSFIRFIEKLYQFDSVILSELLNMKKGLKIRYDKSRRCSENERKIHSLEERMQLSSLTPSEIFESIYTVVPIFYHYESCDQIENQAINQDPSDIPESFPFCEISVSAADDDDEKKVLNVEVLQHALAVRPEEPHHKTRIAVQYAAPEPTCKLQSAPVYYWKNDYLKRQNSPAQEPSNHSQYAPNLLNAMTVETVQTAQVVAHEFHTSHQRTLEAQNQAPMKQNALSGYSGSLSLSGASVLRGETSLSQDLCSNGSRVAGSDGFASVQHPPHRSQSCSTNLSSQSDAISLPVEASLQTQTISSLDGKEVLIFL